MMSDLTSLLLQGPLDSHTLKARLNVSQATLSRLVSAHASSVLKVGRARATRYALLRPLRGNSEFPLWQIDASGQAQARGKLYNIWPQGRCVMLSADGQWQHYPGLPWFLSDMRPQGFLGQAWGRECARQLGLPEDIRLWNDEHSLLALTERGVDVSGNWLIGEKTYQQWLTRRVGPIVEASQKPGRYPELAAGVLSGDEVGSSAGGEQPKFTACTRIETGESVAVLVKFTPPRDNENSQRWRDLLRAEALALLTLQQHGIAAASARLITTVNQQVFLEVERFDRVGERGRRSLVSLEAVLAEFTGTQAHWPEALTTLAELNVIDHESQQRGTLQWAFGRLIANGDMHAGNLSFYYHAQPLTLTPAYDMLPMSFAPNSAGHMRDSVPVIELDGRIAQSVWLQAWQMARQYWQQLMCDDVLSADFRRLAGEMYHQNAGLEPLIRRMA